LSVPAVVLLGFWLQSSPISAEPVTVAEEYQAWRPLLAAELVAHAGAVQAADLYKFLHQGVMGPAHAILDTARARTWLAREWHEAAGQPGDDRPPLLLPLRPDGRLVRVDLVRLAALAAGDHEAAAREALLQAFAGTAATWSGSSATLAQLWSAALADTALWRGHLTADDLRAVEAAVAGQWPAVRHSEAYRERWRPHYRVVDRALLPPSWRDQGGQR
jgi:hypothetical protein